MYHLNSPDLSIFPVLRSVVRMRTGAVSLRTVVTAAAFALLAGDALSPSRAEAGCGHYVLVQRPGHAEGAESRQFPPAPTPCSGPQCSRGDDTPVSPPEAPAPDSDNWGCPSGGPLLASGDLTGLLALASLPRPDDGNTPIFHPPRRQAGRTTR
jgi:hypothetical protein